MYADDMNPDEPLNAAESGDMDEAVAASATASAERPAGGSSFEALLAAACPDDAETLARTAHKLKGQVAYFGVPVLHTQLDELERAARHPAMPYCAPLLGTIRQQLAELYPQLEERAGT